VSLRLATRKASTSFCKQKEEKNFDELKRLASIVTNPTGIRSFLLFFSKRSACLRFQAAS
jgi:hypothetical protein